VELRNTGEALIADSSLTSVVATSSSVDVVVSGCSRTAPIVGGDKRSCFVTVIPTQADLDAGTPVSLQATASAAGLPAVQSAVVNVPAAQNYTAVVALTAAPTYVVGEQCC
jgi:hypothetical protein